MTIDPKLRRHIASFYIRWDLLEKSLGAGGGSVLDFDRDPTWKNRETLQAYASRELALVDGEMLYREVEREAAASDLLLRKLRGSLSYLRALMGERLPLRDYLAQTTEVVGPPDRALITKLNEEYGALLTKCGFENSVQGRDAYFNSLRQYDGAWFVREVTAQHDAVPHRVAEFISLTPCPALDLEISTAEDDRSWRAWISGGFEEPIKLRFNIHQRHRFASYHAKEIAWHEIGGHALHYEALLAAQGAGELDSLFLNFTLHSWEQFHLEGLAQTLSTLAGKELMDEEHRLGVKRAALYNALTDWAQFEVEGGADITAVLHEAEFLSPANDLTPLERDVRNRIADPMLRCYGPVYFPSRQLFLRLEHLEEGRRRKAMQQLYRTLLPPAELTAFIEEVASADSSLSASE